MECYILQAYWHSHCKIYQIIKWNDTLYMCKYSVRLLFCDHGSNLNTFIHSFKDINTYIARKKYGNFGNGTCKCMLVWSYLISLRWCLLWYERHMHSLWNSKGRLFHETFLTFKTYHIHHNYKKMIKTNQFNSIFLDSNHMEIMKMMTL